MAGQNHRGCTPVEKYVKVTVEEYGRVDADDVAAEVYANGPVACSINAGCIEADSEKVCAKRGKVWVLGGRERRGGSLLCLL